MEDSRPKYIASCSFGKDSIATILLAIEHGEPLDEIVYCEVMFDSKTSAEVPEHRDFIYNTALPFFERAGIPVVIVRPDRTMKDFFYQKRGEKSKYCGKMLGFPMVGRCELNGSAKVKAIKAYWKRQPPGSMQYIGIAADEPRRLARMKPNSISLLQKYGVPESEAFEICKKAGLLSPIYEFTSRNGCFFCPNEKESALRHLAERGDRGEKESAAAMLERLMKKYGITESEIAEDRRELAWFRFKTPLERRLLNQIIYAVTGRIASGCVGTYTNRTRKKLGIECTAAERLEIELSFEFYNAALEKELDRFYSAFLNKNHIFPEKAIDEIPDTGEIDLEEAQRLSMMMAGMEVYTRRKALGSGTAERGDQ